MKRLFTKGMAATVTLLFILLFAVSSTQQARAQNPAETPQNDQAQENANAELRNQLNLTPDQVAKIRAILEQNKAERQAARRRVNQAQRALAQTIYSGTASEAEIAERTHELSEAQADEVRLRAATELSISHVLTPEQLAKFKTIRQKAIRDAVIKRRQENANQQKPLNNNKSLENGLKPQTPEERRAERRQMRRNAQPRKNRP
jgi:Spy/CpxP family protein refolding chaperone